MSHNMSGMIAGLEGYPERAHSARKPDLEQLDSRPGYYEPEFHHNPSNEIHSTRRRKSSPAERTPAWRS